MNSLHTFSPRVIADSPYLFSGRPSPTAFSRGLLLGCAFAPEEHEFRAAAVIGDEATPWRTVRSNAHVDRDVCLRVFCPDNRYCTIDLLRERVLADVYCSFAY